ncbi:MAG: glycoside hydrolase family 3 N-terminal domain-containing protein [Pseudomonadota bacterium]
MRTLLGAVFLFWALCSNAWAGPATSQIGAPPPVGQPQYELVSTEKPPLDKAAYRSMVGQMFLLGFDGDTLASQGFQRVLSYVSEGRISGVIFFKRNITNRDELIRMTNALRAAQPVGKPVLIAIDQEGGRVQRLTKTNANVAPTDSAASLVQKGEGAARLQYERLAANLRDLGINFNLGPVVDLNINPASPAIGLLGRSYSSDPELAVRFARIFVEAHRQHGILTSLKHFPGHGSSDQDSHKSFVDVSSSWRQIELQPFQQMIDSGFADSVMVGHVHNSTLDTSDPTSPAPATLSLNVIRDLLRDQMGFTKVVVSDDMDMAAITDFYLRYDALIKAIFAGNDLIIYSGDLSEDRLNGMTDKVLEFVIKQPGFAEIVEKASNRVIRMKEGLTALTTQSVTRSIITGSVAKSRSKVVYETSKEFKTKLWRPPYRFALAREIQR